MSEKYPANQYNLLNEFDKADKKRELEEKQKEEEKKRQARIDEALDELDQEAPDPYGDINPSARNYEPKKKQRSKKKEKRKLTPEEEEARKQEELMRRQYDGR